MTLTCISKLLIRGGDGDDGKDGGGRDVKDDFRFGASLGDVVGLPSLSRIDDPAWGRISTIVPLGK